MQSTLTTAKPSDDPHDIVVVASDAVRVAPSDIAPAEEELSALLQQAARHRSETPIRAVPDFAAGAMVPPVDTTFRSAAVNDGPVPGPRGAMARGAVRAVMILLLAACVGGAAFALQSQTLQSQAWQSQAWQSQALQSQADAAKQMIARWTPQFVLTLLSPENPGVAAPPAAPAVVQADTANAAPPQPAPPAQAAAETVTPAAAPSPESAQLLQSMARDLASLGQQVEQLKASIEQLKAAQPQMSREAARASEPSKTSEPNRTSEPNKTSESNLRPRLSALPARPPAARVRKPPPPYPPPQAAIAPALPLTAAPYYVPRQAEPPPQATEQQLTDPELASVPRPPMPLR
jgi:hypothetical protein